jgi:hypothetical protein
MGRLTKRTTYVLQAFTHLHSSKVERGNSHFLPNESDCPLLAVLVRDSKRNALSLVITPQDNELAGAMRPGDFRSGYHSPIDAGTNPLFLQDFKHLTDLLAYGRMISRDDLCTWGGISQQNFNT